MPPNTLPHFDDAGVSHYRNWHHTVDHPLHRLYDVWNADSNRSSLAGYNGTCEGLRQQIAAAVDADRQLRALGGTWSFTPVAATSGVLLNTRLLNYRFAFPAGLRHPGYQGNGHLVFVQCGMSIASLNSWLEQKGLALPTMGASNGQTITGAMATGTHGAALDFGAVQDYVVAIHLLTSPTDSVWLERASRPIINDNEVNRFHATLARDDNLFNAAVVSFGSFGLVAGVVLQVDPLYSLNSFTKVIPQDATLWDSIAQLDFDHANLPGPPGGPHRPYHYQVLINPFDQSDQAMVTVKYRVASCPANSKRPQSGKITQGDDALGVVGALTDLFPDLSRGIADVFQKVGFKEEGNICGTPRQTFRDTTTRGKAAGVGVGLPLDGVEQAVDIAKAVVRQTDAPVIVALRLVKKSEATLAFTHHDPATCVMDLDAPQSNRSQRAFREVWRRLRAADIQFTFHWGKLNDLDATRVRDMYGGAVDDWLKARRQLLTPDLQRVFANDFTDSLDLSD